MLIAQQTQSAEAENNEQRRQKQASLIQPHVGESSTDFDSQQLFEKARKKRFQFASPQHSLRYNTMSETESLNHLPDRPGLMQAQKQSNPSIVGQSLKVKSLLELTDMQINQQSLPQIGSRH